MATATDTAVKELEQLEAQLAEISALPRQIDEERQERAAAREIARFELQNFYADGGTDKKREALLVKALEEATAAANQPWDERYGGARQAILNLERRIVEFKAEHRDDLAGELLADDIVAREEVATALDRFLEVFHAYERRSQVWVGLLRDINPRVQPTRMDDVQRAVQDLKRAFSNGGGFAAMPNALTHDRYAGLKLPAPPEVQDEAIERGVAA